MPPVDSARPSHQVAPEFAGVKGSRDYGLSFEPATAAQRDKNFAGPDGFENIVNGRYSGIGRGGSVGDELV
jgi:hypothetical protein